MTAINLPIFLIDSSYVMRGKLSASAFLFAIKKQEFLSVRYLVISLEKRRVFFGSGVPVKCYRLMWKYLFTEAVFCLRCFVKKQSKCLK